MKLEIHIGKLDLSAYRHDIASGNTFRLIGDVAYQPDRAFALYGNPEPIRRELVDIAGPVIGGTCWRDYLAYQVEHGDTVILEHPDACTEPAIHAEILERLAIMTTYGIRVVVSTWSFYMLAHACALVACPPGLEADRARHLLTRDPRAFMDPDDIDVLDGGVSTRDPSYGFRFDRVANVSGDLLSRFFRVAEGDES